VIGYLLDREVQPNVFDTPKRTHQIRGYFHDMLTGMETVSQADISHHLGKLSSKKDMTVFVDTYKTYFELMTGEEGADRERLIRHAEKLYAKRKTDKYFHPSAIDGGGPDNLYVVDFRLGSVMKKNDWDGDSMHKWVWD